MDNAIHRIKLYPLESAIGFPNAYPLDSDIHLLNNRGLGIIISTLYISYPLPPSIPSVAVLQQLLYPITAPSSLFMLCPSDFFSVSSLLSPLIFSMATSNNSLPFTPSHFFFPLTLSFLLLDLYQYSFLSSTLACLVFPLNPIPLLLSPPYFYLLISSYPSPNEIHLLN